MDLDAPDHTVKFTATRAEESSNLYQANATGSWNDALDATKSVKTELKQVKSITLPSPTIIY
jgi:hypothetical protein